MKFLYPYLQFPLFIFLLSCSATPKFSSQFNNPDSLPAGEANLEQYILQEQIQRHSIDGIAFYVSNDSDNLYILVDFVSSQIFQQAKEFGFTLYIDSPGNVQRSFGITYPTGLFYELESFPGAQSGYLEEPNWGNMPENKAKMDTAEQNMFLQALISQRKSRRENIQPVVIPLTQLHAQNLFLHINDEERRGRLSYTIPLEVRSRSQFSPDMQPGDVIDIGFEIHPIRLFDLDNRTPATLIRNDPSGGKTQSQSEEEQQQQASLMRIMRRLGGEPYELWFKVQLASPEQ